MQPRKVGISELNKLEIEWKRCLRRMVKGGFRRRKAPPKDMSKEGMEKGSWDYAYIYTDGDICPITGCQSLRIFTEKQQLKWLGHVVRVENTSLEKQTLFMESPGIADRWKRLERRFGVDATQIRRIMRNKSDFNRWISQAYPESSCG